MIFYIITFLLMLCAGIADKTGSDVYVLFCIISVIALIISLIATVTSNHYHNSEYFSLNKILSQIRFSISDYGLAYAEYQKLSKEIIEHELKIFDKLNPKSETGAKRDNNILSKNLLAQLPKCKGIEVLKNALSEVQNKREAINTCIKDYNFIVAGIQARQSNKFLFLIKKYNVYFYEISELEDHNRIELQALSSENL